MSAGDIVHVKCSTRVFVIGRLERSEDGSIRAWCPSCRYTVDLERECEISKRDADRWYHVFDKFQWLGEGRR